MIHTNYQPARKGLLSEQIIKAKRLRVIKNLHNLEHSNGLLALTVVEFQRKRLRYSDRGDFTRCYRGGF